MLQAIKHTLHSRFQRWLNRRIPADRSITLDQSRIFIFPSRPGLYFLPVLLVILLAAINYQNNMVFALVFLLSSAYIVAIVHTYANLSGLSITAVRAHPAFVGDAVRFDIKVARNTQRRYYDVMLSWPGSETMQVSLVDVSETTIPLHLPAARRGLLKPPRLLVETVYPLGLLRAWTWLALDFAAIVYPKPIASELRCDSGDGGEEGEATIVPGTADFYTFKAYQPGDSLKHIAWKKYARGQSLQTKQFADYRDQQFWLDWQYFPGDQELRLSAICYWVLQLEQKREDYGLRLPGVEIAPGHGESYRDQLLKTLALFGTGAVR